VIVITINMCTGNQDCKIKCYPHFNVFFLSVHTFPKNQTHDLGIAASLSNRNVSINDWIITQSEHTFAHVC